MMINDAANILKWKSDFLITTHISPDGDALGSVAALAASIKKLGKNATIFMKDNVPEEYSFLPELENKHTIIPAKHYDAVIVVDCGSIERVDSDFLEFKNYDVLINIDHHKSNTNFGNINIVDKDASSAGVLVYKVLKAAGVSLDLDTATAIYTTILVDTGSFRYSNANAEAFKIASELIDSGVNAWDVAGSVYENQSLIRINLLKLVLAEMEIHIDEGFASMTITQDMLKKANADFDVTDGFINFARSIKGVEVALQFKQLGTEKYKLSMRSKGNVDVSEIAENFGGGGHKNAAGCYLDGDIDSVKEELFGHVIDHIRKSHR